MKLSELDSEITIQQAVSAKKTQLEQQIAEAEASGTPQKTLPAYDNTKNEINELNAILADATSYNINFSEADLTDAVVRRVVDISFTCDSYHADWDSPLRPARYRPAHPSRSSRSWAS